MRRVIILLLVLLMAGCTGDDGYRLVKRVVDGDTFVLENNEKIRLTGINAPESRKTGRKNVEYFGKQSKEYLKQYLTGKRVRLEYDVTKTDRYNRTLAYVYMEDGTFLNADLVKQGYATVYTVPPNVKYADLFLDMEREARENERGLWALANSKFKSQNSKPLEERKKSKRHKRKHEEKVEVAF